MKSKQLHTLNFYQRTATGGKDAARNATRVYVASNPEAPAGVNDAVMLLVDEDLPGYKDYVKLYGHIRITHPALMAGSWNEIKRDMMDAAERWLIGSKMAVHNDWGVLFWRGGEAKTTSTAG